MRTTLDIEDDVLAAAKALAAREGSTAGRVISALARKGLAEADAAPDRPPWVLKDGVPTVSSRGGPVTMEFIQQIMDEEGI